MTHHWKINKSKSKRSSMRFMTSWVVMRQLGSSRNRGAGKWLWSRPSTPARWNTPNGIHDRDNDRILVNNYQSLLMFIVHPHMLRILWYIELMWSTRYNKIFCSWRQLPKLEDLSPSVHRWRKIIHLKQYLMLIQSQIYLTWWRMGTNESVREIGHQSHFKKGWSAWWRTRLPNDSFNHNTNTCRRVAGTSCGSSHWYKSTAFSS